MRWNSYYTLGWAAVLATLLAYELWALLDEDARTPSLTATTVRYVPWYATLTLLVWLVVHFAVRYANPAYVARLRGK